MPLACWSGVCLERSALSYCVINYDSLKYLQPTQLIHMTLFHIQNVSSG